MNPKPFPLLIKTSPGSPYLANSLLKSSSVISAGKFPTNNRQRCVYVFSPGRLSKERFALNPYKESDQFEPPLSAAHRIAGRPEDPRRTQNAAPRPREEPKSHREETKTAQGHREEILTAIRCHREEHLAGIQTAATGNATEPKPHPRDRSDTGTARTPLRRRRLCPAPPLKMAARARGAAAILCLREAWGGP